MAWQSWETLRVAHDQERGLLDVVLDKPKGNVLDARLMGELLQVLDGPAQAAGLKLVVLRGAGGHFSFGASIEEHRRDQAPAMLRTFHALCRAVARHPVPVAAVVEGKCLGGAFELILCCHLVLLAPGAVLACPEIKLGVLPPVLAAIGHLRLGGATAERLLLTGAECKAAEAERLGLGVLLDGETWPAALAWFDRHLRGLSAFSLQQAVRATRQAGGVLQALGEGLDQAEQQYLSQLLPSHDGNEGIEAYLARRPPQWLNA